MYFKEVKKGQRIIARTIKKISAIFIVQTEFETKSGSIMSPIPLIVV